MIAKATKSMRVPTKYFLKLHAHYHAEHAPIQILQVALVAILTKISQIAFISLQIKPPAPVSAHQILILISVILFVSIVALPVTLA
jgi:hypothetical protein